ncbi:MAG: TlpA family protein disulfide reductase [Bacteroidetes bacterium]|nr:TlpA family protein disulfide reductase [Bacteroidota bacterium]
MIQRQTLKALFLILIIFSFISCGQKNKQCVIKGDVIGRESETLLLYKASEDCRDYNIEIPIINNSFEYVMIVSHPEVYELVFKEEHDRGSFFRNSFFVKEGEVKFTLYAEKDEDNNLFVGNNLNDNLNGFNQTQFKKFWSEIYKYNDSLDLLDEKGSLYSSEWINLVKKLAENKDEKLKKRLFSEQRYLRNTGLMYSVEGRKYQEKQDSIIDEMMLWEYNYIKENTSLLSYYLFMRDIQNHSKSCCWKEGDTALMNAAQINFQRLSSEYPDHPYSSIVKDLLEGLKNIHEGGMFIDFSAPDINGENILLSSVINNNKVVLLDLWSTWCSPCIKKSREMVPMYEEFKNLGFEIVGVTRGYGDADNLNKSIKKENYPWINIIDKDNQNRVWEKYSISNRGGGTFLITSSGKIIAIDLSAVEVKQKLTELLQ